MDTNPLTRMLEHIAPLTTDQEGHLKGGFLGFCGSQEDGDTTNTNCECPEPKRNTNCECPKPKRDKNANCKCPAPQRNANCECPKPKNDRNANCSCPIPEATDFGLLEF